MREEVEAAAAPAQPRGPMSAYQGRVPPVRQAGVSKIRDQGAVCCFQTLLWPHSQPRPPPSFCPLAHPPPNALQLWVPAQEAIKGVSPSMPSPPPGPVLGCSPGPEQTAPSHHVHTQWPRGPGRDGDKIPPLSESDVFPVQPPWAWNRNTREQSR